METEKLLINGIPAIIWGEKSDKVYIHVHGKMSRKEYADGFASIAEEKGYQTLSFDLPGHGERDSSECCHINEGKRDLKIIFDFAKSHWHNISLFACSLGAYFSLNTYADYKFDNCLFQSPVVDMHYLINNMMLWFDITEETLKAEKEISTPLDLMTWDYLEYVKNHPVVKWESPTTILYAEKDNLQSYSVVNHFAEKYNCKLMVSSGSEHPFMEERDFYIVEKWLRDNI